MRIRMFTEVEVDDEAVMRLKEQMDKLAIQSNGSAAPIDFLVADSFGRQIEKIVMAFNGVKEVKSVQVPILIGL